MSIERPRAAYADRDHFARAMIALLERARELERELGGLERGASEPAPHDRHDQLAAHVVLGALVLGRRFEALLGAFEAELEAPAMPAPAASAATETLLR